MWDCRDKQNLEYQETHLKSKGRLILIWYLIPSRFSRNPAKNLNHELWKTCKWHLLQNSKNTRVQVFPRKKPHTGGKGLFGVWLVGWLGWVFFFKKFLPTCLGSWSFLLQEWVLLDRSPNVFFPDLHGSFKNWHPMWSPKTAICYFSGCRPPIHLCNPPALAAFGSLKFARLLSQSIY